MLATPAVAAGVLDPLINTERHQAACDFREARANDHLVDTTAVHENNDDETNVVDFLGQFSKTLHHDASGVVVAGDFQSLLDSIQAGTFSAFETVPAGGSVKLANPFAAQVYDLEGNDSHDYVIKAAPTLDCAEAAGEMVEVYLQALLRDVTFDEYVKNKELAEASVQMSGLSDFHGPT